MNASSPRPRTSFANWIPLLACLLLLRAPEASAVPFGSLNDWATLYSGTISLDDKTFTLLGSSGGWDGSENVNLGYLPAFNIHSLGIDALENFSGPMTLTVEYRVDITSSYVFAGTGIDQTIIAPGVTTTKDIYGSLAELMDNTTPGSGTVTTLSIVDFDPIPDPPVYLPPLRSIWVRDTIEIAEGVGVQAISNSFVQVVPEPGSLLLAATGTGLAALLRRSRGRSRPERMIGAARGGARQRGAGAGRPTPPVS